MPQCVVMLIYSLGITLTWLSWQPSKSVFVCVNFCSFLPEKLVDDNMQILLACCGIIHPLDLMVLAIFFQRHSHSKLMDTLLFVCLFFFLDNTHG